MATQTRQQLSNKISDLCEQHACNAKIQKVHTSQYVDRGWNPHPPQRFVNWWGSEGAELTEKKTERGWSSIDAVRAFNCETVREVYREAKEIGVV